MSSTNTKSRRRDWWGWWVFGALLVALGTGGGIFWLLQVKLAATPSVYQNARSAVTLTGIAGAAVLAAVALLRLRATDREHQLSRDRHELEQAKHDQAIADSQRARDDRATDLETARKQREEDTARADISALRARYTTAAEQLGHSSPAIRLAGVFAMAALADDWVARGNEAQVQTCIDVLCSIIRTPPSADLADHEQRADLEVRQTITRTIASHLQASASPAWHGRNFDFTGATFTGTHSFNRALFAGGTVTFAESRFLSGAVTFDDARLTHGGTLTFARAKFIGSTVRFHRAQFSGGVLTFHSAHFAGGALLFPGAEFTGTRVLFQRAQFARGGRAMFSGSHFDIGTVSFSEAGFVGGTVTFNDTEFAGGEVSFAYTEFADGEVTFEDAQFTGGTVRLTGSRFTGGTVNFDGASQAGTRWPVSHSWQYPGVVVGHWATEPPRWWPVHTRGVPTEEQESGP